VDQNPNQEKVHKLKGYIYFKKQKRLTFMSTNNLFKYYQSDRIVKCSTKIQ